jgi:hypothetical protein
MAFCRQQRHSCRLASFTLCFTALSLYPLCLFPPLCLPRHSTPVSGIVSREEGYAQGKAPTWRALLHVSLGTDPILIVIAVVIVIAATTATA